MNTHHRLRVELYTQAAQLVYPSRRLPQIVKHLKVGEVEGWTFTYSVEIQLPFLMDAIFTKPAWLIPLLKSIYKPSL